VKLASSPLEDGRPSLSDCKPLQYTGAWPERDQWIPAAW